jgi:uncharacterized membrane protein YsdA (DUF1294 family)/cold shock CspA family protein
MQELAGRVDHWNDQKGYGFILADDGRKVFFHISAMRGAQRPQTGERVYFLLAQGEQRLSASHVRHSQLVVDNAQIRIKPRTRDAKKANPTAIPKPSATRKTFLLPEHAIPWKSLILLLVLPLVAAIDVIIEYGVWWIVAVYAATSLLTYYFYWDDKRRAQRNEWRIPETNLHFWSLVGGWPGAFIAQQQFRHKTKKLSFRAVFWLIVMVHQLVWFDWLFMDSKGLGSLIGHP